MLFLLMLYFSLIVSQWNGLLDFTNIGSSNAGNIINCIANAIALVFLTITLSYLHLGVNILGIGIVSIIGYCMFLIWLDVTTPKGPLRVPLFGEGTTSLAASMGQAFSIQSFFIPILC
jgi:hypothetical protein